MLAALVLLVLLVLVAVIGAEIHMQRYKREWIRRLQAIEQGRKQQEEEHGKKTDT